MKKISVNELKKKRDYLLDIACDFIYLIVTCKHSELNKIREKELLKLKKRIKIIDDKIAVMCNLG